MSKSVTRLMAATAALGLVVAPIMAQANTRASSGATAYSTSNAGPGLGRSGEGEGQAEGATGIIIGVVSFSAIIAGIAVAADSSGDDDTSPGT